MFCDSARQGRGVFYEKTEGHIRQTFRGGVANFSPGNASRFSPFPSSHRTSKHVGISNEFAEPANPLQPIFQ